MSLFMLGAVDLSTSGGPVAAVTISPSSLTCEVGDTEQFVAVATDVAGRMFKPPVVSWTATGCGTIDPSGRFTAVHSGTCAVVARVGQMSAKTTVTVQAPPSERPPIVDGEEDFEDADLVAETMDDLIYPRQGLASFHATMQEIDKQPDTRRAIRRHYPDLAETEGQPFDYAAANRWAGLPRDTETLGGGGGHGGHGGGGHGHGHGGGWRGGYGGWGWNTPWVDVVEDVDDRVDADAIADLVVERLAEKAEEKRSSGSVGFDPGDRVARSAASISRWAADGITVPSTSGTVKSTNGDLVVVRWDGADRDERQIPTGDLAWVGEIVTTRVGDAAGVQLEEDAKAIGERAKQMSQLKNVTVRLAGSLLKGGYVAMAEADRVGTPDRVNRRANIRGHLDWHRAALTALYTTPDALYASAEDLKKWTLEAYVESNVEKESRSIMDAAWSVMWSEIGAGIADYAKRVGNTVAAPFIAAGWIATHLWMVGLGAIAAVGLLGYATYKILVGSGVGSAMVKRYLPS